jgi:hypothetical protein
MPLPDLFIKAQLDQLRATKRLAEGALAQLRDEDFFFKLSPNQNSIAVYIKHLSGNMISRFTDFLTTDGEKPSRDRDAEFVEEAMPREQIMTMWEHAWSVALSAIEKLTPTDLESTITIRLQPHSIPMALARHLSHVSYHVGQIVLLAKHIKTLHGDNWNYLTVAPGKSKEFNRTKGMST